jgi:hypothetical protein
MSLILLPIFNASLKENFNSSHFTLSHYDPIHTHNICENLLMVKQAQLEKYGVPPYCPINEVLKSTITNQG